MILRYFKYLAGNQKYEVRKNGVIKQLQIEN